MKTTYYFSHDFNARTDKKIKLLLKEKGWTGYGLFWAIVEDLYNNANALPLDYESIAFDLRTQDTGIIESIINDYDLFKNDGEYFWSESVQRRLDERKERSIKARESAKVRWDNANAMQTHSDGNAIKERKGNKSKGNETKIISSIRPIPTDFNGLPDQYIESAKRQVFTTKKIMLENSQISELWEAFKLQHLNGETFYNSEHDVYKHFVNWFKSQKFENKTQNNGTKSRSQRQSEGLQYLLQKGREEYAKVMATNQQGKTD